MLSRLPLKELLLALYLLATAPAVAERVGSLGLTPPLFLYLILYLLLVLCLLLGAYTRSLPLRAAYAVILSAAAMFLPIFERITGQFLTYDSFITMLFSTGDTGNALAQYGGSFVVPAAAGLILFAGILLKPVRRPPWPAPVFASAPIVGLLLLSFIFYVRGGDGGRGLPPSFTSLAYLDLAAYERLSEPFGEREPVRLRPPAAPPPRDLVFVIDESVAGQYLDLNNPEGVRSGLAGARPGLAIRNYGYAASITNCSWGTNLTLRYGGTREDYRRINATGPSLFQYAKRAGFHTVYIDAQRPDPAKHPLTDGELAAVDRTISLGNVPVVDRDQQAATLVARYLNDGRPDFILVNKVGAHFPVHDKYPDAFMRYRPALPRGRFLNVSDTGSRAGFGGTPEEWRLYRNAYRNTLLWNVGAFFDRLFARSRLANATLVYTSDHGQNLHERGGGGLNTHCSPDPVPEEGLVPLVVVEGARLRTLDWDKALPLNRNRASHYTLFPTLLALMGYDERDVAPLYGEGLDRPVKGEFAFNARFNARLGKGPVWEKIDLARIVRPSRAEGEAMALKGGNGGRGKD